MIEGTKGDFVFRDFDEEGNEIISIMFEMKNEADDSVNRKTNESHFKKLDADRKKKNCEYAVLVSLLEPENELYNAGITDVSYRFEKMYVIRPQFSFPSSRFCATQRSLRCSTVKSLRSFGSRTSM